MMAEVCTSGSFQACNGERWVHVYTADDERLWSINAKTGREVWTVRDFAARLLTRDVQDPKQMSQGAGGRGGAACPGSNPLFCDGFESGGTGGWLRVSQGRDVSDYIWRGDKLLGAAYVTGGGARHFAVDHLGTVRLVVSDVDPQVVAQPNYYPFGREVTTTTQIEEPMKFTGHERDAFDTLPVGDDVDYMHARFRSPVTGRFLAVDQFEPWTLQFGDSQERRRFQEHVSRPQAWNRYSYVLGNPMTFVDPDGEAFQAVMDAPLVLKSGSLILTGEAAVAATGAALTGGAVVLAGGVGYAIGTGINEIPGVSESIQEGLGAVISFFADNTKTRLGQVEGLINSAAIELAKIGSAGGPDKDPAGKHHKKEIKAMLQKALQKAKRLPTKLRETTSKRILELAEKAGVSL